MKTAKSCAPNWKSRTIRTQPPIAQRSLKFEGEDDLVPIFAEQAIPTPAQEVIVTHLEDHYGYITDLQVREKAMALLDDVKRWKPGSISLDPIKYAISLKVNGRVFAYFHPRRKHYVISTYSDQYEWTDYQVRDGDDLDSVVPIMKAAMERQAAGGLSS